MKKKSSSFTDQEILRQKAEGLLKKRPLENTALLSETDTLKLIHELEVHQIELDMQNEELISARTKALENASDKIAGLYDLAPSGYFTISNTGEIVKVNLLGAAMLGRERGHLIGRRIGFFISDDTKPVFVQFLDKIFKNKAKASCEVTLLTNDLQPVNIHLTGIADTNCDQCFVTAVDITERRQAGETLKKSQRLLRLSFESQKDTILLSIDNDYRYIYFNKAHKDVMKQVYNKDVELRMNILECITSESDRKTAKENYDRALKGESHSNIRIYGDLKLDYYESYFNPILNEGNEIIGATAMARNITQRKAEEDALQSIMSLTEATLESIHNGILVVTPKGTILKSNRKFAELWRIPPDMLNVRDDKILLQCVIDQLIDPNAFIEKVSELYSKPEAESTDLIYFKDGRVFERISKPMFINGEPEGRVWSYLDITERNKAELLIKVSEEKFRNLVETTNDIIWETNIGGQYTYVSPQIEGILGYKPEAFIGHSPFEFMPPEESAKIKIRSDVIVATGKAFNGLVNSNLHKDGRIIILETSGVPVYDCRNILIGFRGIDRDITERMKAAEEIKLLNAKLEQRVKQRTHQLENANKELEAFSYSVAHNLRSPLRGIDGWGLALLEDYNHILDEQGSIYLSRMRSEAQQMGNLIDDLLKLSRVTLLEMCDVDVDLTALVRSITGQLQLAHPKRQIEFNIESGLVVKGDLSMLQIALTNLIENAYKFTTLKAVGRIEFGKLMIDDNLTFFIRDNGVGFNMDYSKNLFTAFHRMHRQSDYPGSGIGLATVHRIITRHGGRIWAESKPDEGATFYFTL